MIRIIDFFLAVGGLIILAPVILVIFILGLVESRRPIFIQQRVGRYKKTFKLIKFRTMIVGTASVGTHEVDLKAITYMGRILRKTKIDELPQLFNVLIGDMSIVGPRPCLPNQFDVIKARDNKNIFKVRPGITGLSQIKKIDMSTPKLLAKTDASMIENMSIRNYFSFIFFTLIGRGGGDRIKV